MSLPDYLAELNPDQLKAAQTLDGPVLIQAGAGSGKTKTVIARIHNLIDHQIAPENILAITFTNKAANELKDRLPQEAQGVFASTIHAFCAFILRKLPHLEEYTSEFSIVDTDDQKSIIKNAKDDFFEANKNMSDAVKKQYNDLPPKTAIAYLSRYTYDMHHDTTTRKKFLVKQRLDTFETFYETIAKYYTDYLVKQNMMDFDGLLYNTVRLFHEQPDDLELAQQTYRYISVDEYQDVSDIQEELINMLANTKQQNICVVGDPNQSIYGFRGAKVQNILHFKDKYPRAKVVTIMHNYRSTQNILDVANHVISHNKKALTINPKLDAIKPNGKKPFIVQNYNDYEEAHFVTAKIQELIAKGIQPNQIAILYRTNSLSRLFEKDLIKNNIKYKIVGSLNFYERKEIKDLLAYLKVIANPANDLAFTRIVNTPSRKIGTITIDALSNFAKAQQPEISMFNAAQNASLIVKDNGKTLSPTIIQSLNDFTKYILNFNLQQVGTVYDVLSKLAKDFYLQYAATLDNSDRSKEGDRVDNVQQLINAAHEFDVEHPNLPLGQALNLFLQDAALATDTSNDGIDAVQLMTIHSAKGLEFDTVFIVGMEKQLFPSSYVTPKTMPEERRLFYVAITRAKRELYMTYANERTLWGRMQTTIRSPFLSEIDPNSITEINNDHYGAIKAGQFTR